MFLKYSFHLQAVQLLVCDWLLSTRTAVWQEENLDSDGVASPAAQTELLNYHSDLASLRKVAQHLKAAMPRVSTGNMIDVL